MIPENFQTQGSIYFQHGGLDLDLHNNYDFVGFRYSIAERSIDMEWVRSSGDWVDPRAPAQLFLSLRGIAHLSAVARDPEMPFTEDDCLSSLCFLDPDMAVEYAFVSDDADPSWHWFFLFQSGFGLRVAGETAHLSTK